MGTETQGPELLTCWKDIAKYMGKGVRTVQRWERTLDLPVSRPRGRRYKSSVVARPKDIDAWLASRWSGRDGQEAKTISRSRTNSELSSTIQVSRNLRHANHQLTAEIRSALAALMQNCAEMARHAESGIPK